MVDDPSVEPLRLLAPRCRHLFGKFVDREPRRLTPIEDGLDDIRSEEDAADVGGVDGFGGGEVLYGG